MSNNQPQFVSFSVTFRGVEMSPQQQTSVQQVSQHRNSKKEKKTSSIHCGRYVTSHGLAVNCNTDLSWFENIVPCGIAGKGVTSLSQELGREVMIKEAIPVLLEAFSKQFNCILTETGSFNDQTQ